MSWTNEYLACKAHKPMSCGPIFVLSPNINPFFKPILNHYNLDARAIGAPLHPLIGVGLVGLFPCHTPPQLRYQDHASHNPRRRRCLPCTNRNLGHRTRFATRRGSGGRVPTEAASNGGARALPMRTLMRLRPVSN